MQDPDRVVAVGLLTERDLTVLGQAFKRFYPIDDLQEFEGLLGQIDKVDQKGSVTAAS